MLEALFEETPEESFINDYLPDLQGNICFYESLNIINHEFPSIFKNKTAYDRVLCILNVTSKKLNDKGINKLNKKMIKEINHKIRKCE